MNDWFEWNGVKCTTYGMRALTQPTIARGSERVTYVSIPGKSGSLTQLESEHIYEDVTPACTCIIDDPYQVVEGLSVSRIARICGWLTGQGQVIFANQPEGHYKGRIVNQIGFDKIVRGNPHMSFPVQFRVKPFLYLTSGQTPVEITTSPYTFTNLGNLPSEPLIRIEGTGEISLMIGHDSLLIKSFDNISYIMIDSEAGVAYQGSIGNPTDPLIPLNSRVAGEEIRIPTGVSHLLVEGTVTKLTIIPRWRYLG